MKNTFVFFFLFTFATNAAEMRTWTSTSGQIVEAELVRVSDDGKTVSLQRADGKKGQASLDKLSKADQEYINQQAKTNRNTQNEQKNLTDDGTINITEENLIRYDDDGTVVIRTKNGDEQKKHISTLSQESMNSILTWEIKNIAVSDKLFPPERIKEQIEAYFIANPIKAEEKTEYVEQDAEKKNEYKRQLMESQKRLDAFQKRIQTLYAQQLSTKKNSPRYQQLDKLILEEEEKSQEESMKTVDITMKSYEKIKIKKIIDRSLTTYEKNSIVLALLKLQEATGEKYKEGIFKSIMLDVKREKEQFYSTQIDVYVMVTQCIPFAYSQVASVKAQGTLVGMDVRDDLRLTGVISREHQVRRDIQEVSRVQTEREKEETRKQRLQAILPYCNKFSAFKHSQKESERLQKQKNAERTKQFEEKAKDLFK